MFKKLIHSFKMVDVCAHALFLAVHQKVRRCRVYCHSLGWETLDFRLFTLPHKEKINL